jgi:hypothetical protein
VELDNLLFQEGIAREKVFLADQEHKRQKAKLKNFIDLTSSDNEWATADRVTAVTLGSGEDF